MNVLSKNKRQRILDATMELIAKNGLHATPMSQISKHSKVSAGAIYNYFPSKKILINNLYLELKKEIINSITEDIDQQTPYKNRFFFNFEKIF